MAPSRLVRALCQSWVIDRHQRGARAERLALDHLKTNGLRYLTRNYRCSLGEIDLVMRDGAVLVFVEVRYRRSSRFGGAVDTITSIKQRRLRRAAEHYRLCHPAHRRASCRFDVVAVEGFDEQISWLKDAF